MAVLVLSMSSPTVGKSVYSYALSEMSYFHGLEKPGTFGVPKWNLRYNWSEFFKVYETGLPERTGDSCYDGLVFRYNTSSARFHMSFVFHPSYLLSVRLFMVYSSRL